jgi:hypothetical protein
MDTMEQNRQHTSGGWMRLVVIRTTDTLSAWRCWTALTTEHCTAVNPRNKHKSRTSVQPYQQHALGGILNNEHTLHYCSHTRTQTNTTQQVRHMKYWNHLNTTTTPHTLLKREINKRRSVYNFLYIRQWNAGDVTGCETNSCDTCVYAKLKTYTIHPVYIAN